ncbi:hypothetical protein ACOME3_002895 [Neoechinorhynchus agilis]
MTPKPILKVLPSDSLIIRKSLSSGGKVGGIVYLTNENVSDIVFEIKCSKRDFLCVKPSKGILGPDKTTAVEVYFKNPDYIKDKIPLLCLCTKFKTKENTNLNSNFEHKHVIAIKREEEKPLCELFQEKDELKPESDLEAKKHPQNVQSNQTTMGSKEISQKVVNELPYEKKVSMSAICFGVSIAMGIFTSVIRLLFGF